MSEESVKVARGRKKTTDEKYFAESNAKIVQWKEDIKQHSVGSKLYKSFSNKISAQ